MRSTVACVCLATAMLVGSTSIARADDDGDELAQQARTRSKLRTYHRSMGYTTWISFAATMTLGTFRYANVVGFGQPLCAEGNTPILGRTWGCGDGLHVQHVVSASFTTLSYISTRTLAALMPDP